MVIDLYMLKAEPFNLDTGTFPFLAAKAKQAAIFCSRLFAGIYFQCLCLRRKFGFLPVRKHLFLLFPLGILDFLNQSLFPPSLLGSQGKKGSASQGLVFCLFGNSQGLSDTGNGRTRKSVFLAPSGKCAFFNFDFWFPSHNQTKLSILRPFIPAHLCLMAV